MASKKKTQSRKKVEEPSSTSLEQEAPRPYKALMLPRWIRTPAGWGALATLVIGSSLWGLTGLLLQSGPFIVPPVPDGLRIEGASVLRPGEVEQVFADDFGRSLADVNLADRLEQLESLAWVRTATVAKVWPNAISVTVFEREPVAYLRIPASKTVRMIDMEGEILDLRSEGELSLPVLFGIDGAMPVEQRQLRLRLFKEVMQVFDAKGRAFAESVSEVDVSDVRNAVVLAKHDDQLIKLQMGDRHLRHRLDVFLNYIEAWRAEFGPVESVDLRFEKQVAVQPIQEGESAG